MDDLRQSVRLNPIALEKVDHEKNISNHANLLVQIQNWIDKLSSNITDVSSEIDAQPHTTATDMENTVKTIVVSRIEEIVDKKVQTAIIEAAGSWKLKKIATDATIDIIKEDEYTQKLGAELLNKPNVLNLFNIAASWYVQVETKNALENVKNLPPQDSRGEKLIDETKAELNAEIKILRQQLNIRIAEIDHNIYAPPEGLDRDIREIDIQIDDLQSLFQDNIDQLEKRINNINAQL